MRRFAVGVCAVLLVSSIAPLYAGDRVGIGVKAGSLGLGVDITGRINDWFNVRGTFNSGSVTHSLNASGVDYDGDVALGASGILLDFFPMKGNFRLTAGYLKNRTGVDLSGTPTSDTQIGDTTYTPAEIGTIHGDLDYKDKVPYFGVGFGSAARGPGRIRFLMDIGVLSQGSGNVTLTTSSGLVSPADLKKEEQNVEDDIRNFKLFPVIEFGISFRL